MVDHIAHSGMLPQPGQRLAIVLGSSLAPDLIRSRGRKPDNISDLKPQTLPLYEILL